MLFMVKFTRCMIGVNAANTPPTASNGEVTATEDTDYTFTAADFNFSDTDAGAALSSVKITSLPASGTGTLKVNGTVIASGDLPKAVTKVDIDASKLTYTPPADANGDDYATFQFKVNDGMDDSAAASTMTIDVTAVNDDANRRTRDYGPAGIRRHADARLQRHHGRRWPTGLEPERYQLVTRIGNSAVVLSGHWNHDLHPDQAQTSARRSK